MQIRSFDQFEKLFLQQSPVDRQLTRKSGESMGSIGVKYLKRAEVGSFFLVVFVFGDGGAFTMFFFQVAHRSLNRPLSAMDWFTLVTSADRFFSVTHQMRAGVDDDCTRLTSARRKTRKKNAEDADHVRRR